MSPSKANLWNPGKRAPKVSSRFEYEGRIRAISFSHASALFAMSFEKPTGKRKTEYITLIYEVSSGKTINTFSGLGNHHLSSDSSLIASGPDNLTIFSIKSGKEIFKLESHEAKIRSYCISPDSELAAVSLQEDQAEVFDIRTGKSILACDPNTAYVNAMAFSPDSSQLAVFGEYETDYDYIDSDETTGSMWRVKDNPAKVWEKRNGLFEQVLFSPDGTRVYARGTGEVNRWKTSSITVLDSAAGEELADWKATGMRFFCIDVSPDGTRLAGSGGRDSEYNDMPTEIILWDTASGEVSATLEGHNNLVEEVEFSPDGKLLVSQSRDKTLRIWDVHTGKQLRLFEEPEHYLDQINTAFSPDGAVIAISAGKKLNFYDTRSGDEVMQSPEG